MTTVSIADQLKILVELQKLDGQIYGFRRELNAQPAEIARLKEDHLRKTQGVQTIVSRYQSLEVKRNQLETDLGQKEQQTKKLQIQMYQVKTNKEYSAFQLEIAGLKADQSVLEEEILKLMEEIDRAKSQMASEREGLKTEEAALNNRVAVIGQESEKIKAEMERMRAQRGQLAPKVDPRILRQYERVLERREGSALVPVRGNACSGCNMILPPQVINEVQISARLIPCESCARILYIGSVS